MIDNVVGWIVAAAPEPTLILRESTFFKDFHVLVKVHIFWEGHKILRNLYRRFDRYCIGQIYGGYFVAFSEYMILTIQLKGFGDST